MRNCVPSNIDKRLTSILISSQLRQPTSPRRCPRFHHWRYLALPRTHLDHLFPYCSLNLVDRLTILVPGSSIVISIVSIFSTARLTAMLTLPIITGHLEAGTYFG